MGVPNGTNWGSIFTDKHGGKGQLGIYVDKYKENGEDSIYYNIQLWYWTNWAVSDANNTFTLNYSDGHGSNGQFFSGSKNINTENIKGGTAILIYSTTQWWGRDSYDRTITLSASFSRIEWGGNAGNHSITFTVPRKPLHYVRFDGNGGSNIPGTISKYLNTTITIPNTLPVKKGYNFKNWYASPQGIYYNRGDNYSGSDTTLSAQWIPQQYILKYNENGGDSHPADQSIEYGKNIEIKKYSGNKRGHDFQNWEDPTGGLWSGYNNTWTFVNGEWGIQNNILSLKAIWKPQTFTIKYNVMGGDGSCPNQTISYNSIFNNDILPGKKEGYTFIGWFDSSGHNWTDFSKTWTFINGDYGISGNILTLTAKWSTNEIDVLLASNGGTLVEKDSPYIINKQGFVVPKSTSSNVFKQFNYESESQGLPSHEQLKLIKKGYKSQFPQWIESFSNKKIPNSEKIIPFLAVDKDNGLSLRVQPITAQYTALWSPKTYRIFYHINDDSQQSIEEKVVYDSKYFIKDNPFNVIGKNFLGWNESPNGTGKNWTSLIGKEYVWKEDRDIHLYAQWKILANCFVKKENTYKMAMLFLKSDNAYKTGVVWVKDSGIYKHSQIN